MKRLISAALAVSYLLVLSGCAQSVNAPGLTISVTNAFSTIQAGSAPVTLTAVVGDFGRAGVKWAITLAGQPCSPGCGTLIPLASNPRYEATYTPPKTPPLNANATITVTSAVDKALAYVFNITITPGPSVSITDKFSTQFASGPPVQVIAQVKNDSTNSGVTWSLTAGGGTGTCSPTCGTLTPGAAPTFTATYVPPATVPTDANASPTITATLVVDSTQSDSFSFTITSPNGLFKGNYAFLLRGYDVTGSPTSMAGSVTADGNGNITGGDFDINNGGGISAIPSPLTGTYSMDLSFNGVTRGTFTITSFSFGGGTHLSMKFTLSADGKQGTIVELDGIGFRTVGSIQLQDPSALTTANPAGTYAFGLDSDAPVGGRSVEAGQFVLSATGVTSGLVDASKAGDATPRYAAAPLATGGLFTSPDSSGRGTLTLNIPATATGPASSTLYAYYIVNSGQLNLLEIDSGATFGTVQAGVALAQKTLTASSVNTKSILQFAGMDAIPGTASGIGPDVIIGVLTISGGNFNLNFDINDLGKVLINHPDNGSVTFDPTTGRGMLTSVGGFGNSFVDSAVFYLSDTGHGFIIDADPSTPNGTPPDQAVTNNAFSGTFVPQATGPFTSASLSNNLIFSSGASAIPAIPSIESAVNINNTQTPFTYTGIADLTAPDPIDNEPNATFSGTLSLTNGNLGHGTISLPQAVYGDFSGNQLFPATFYMIGPNQFVSIGTHTGTFSGISFFNPQ